MTLIAVGGGVDARRGNKAASQKLHRLKSGIEQGQRAVPCGSTNNDLL
jgi:hypothetical protein